MKKLLCIALAAMLVVACFAGCASTPAATGAEPTATLAEMVAASQDFFVDTAKAKEAADTAAKVAAWTTLWMFIALLLGAFFASLCATFGGRRRDAVTYIDHTTTTTVVR